MIPSDVQMGKAMDVEDVNALHVVKLFGKMYQVSHHVVISSCDTGADECRQANLLQFKSDMHSSIEVAKLESVEVDGSSAR